MKRRQMLAAAGLTAVAGCLGGDTRGDDNTSADEETTTLSDNETDNLTETPNNTTDEAPTEESPATGREVTFESCRRATVTGAFEHGDVAFASTGFYDDGLYGDTILEDGVVFGEDVAAPFNGTVVFTLGEESQVDETADRITITIPEYGTDGTVIATLTTDPSDYETASATHGNPHADACLNDIAEETQSDPPNEDSDSSNESETDTGPEHEQKGTFRVISLDHNTPVNAGEEVVATTRIRNVGEMAGTQTVRLIVGHTPTVNDTRTLTLAADEMVKIDLSYTASMVRNDQEFPIVVETDDDAAERDVLVYGTNE